MSELTFEEARKELERIVAELESGRAGLEQALALWERGEELHRLCLAKLDSAQGIEGFAGVISLVDRAGGKQLTITLWESEEAMRASEEAANRLRQGAADALQAKIASVERYEVVVSEIRAPALSG